MFDQPGAFHGGGLSRRTAGPAHRVHLQLGEYLRGEASLDAAVANIKRATRDFVRRSPGIALAGAAIVGFALARLIQSGFDAERNR